ncbi:MAG: hypothetical protein Q8O93_04595 [bacterium]|nr:hypothetical protein [bacterium]
MAEIDKLRRTVWAVLDGQSRYSVKRLPDLKQACLDNKLNDLAERLEAVIQAAEKAGRPINEKDAARLAKIELLKNFSQGEYKGEDVALICYDLHQLKFLISFKERPGKSYWVDPLEII